MKLLSTSLLAAVAALGLAACDNPGPTTASPGTTATPQNVQQGVGTSQESQFVTQRGGSSQATQAGRITGIQQSGGGDVSIQRAPSSGTVGTRQRITGQRTDGTVDRGANVGAPATQGAPVTNPRN